jgi:hypothetical protein
VKKNGGVVCCEDRVCVGWGSGAGVEMDGNRGYLDLHLILGQAGGILE